MVRTKNRTFFGTFALEHPMRSKAKMKTATVSDFRQNLKEYLESIERDQDFLLLSGPKKKGFVVLTLEQFESMEETAHLLSSPANAARLAKSLKQAEQGKVVFKTLDKKKKK